MNGRVYDSTLGRFTTADPYVQAPSFSQSYNRYSYAFNNPLSGTDPSGFGVFDIVSDLFSAQDDFVRNPFKIENLFALNHSIPGHGTIDHFMMTHEWARVAGRAAATFFAGWFGPWAAAGANAMITGYEVWLAGGSSEDIHKASAISFATSMAFNFVGDGAAAIAQGGNAGGAIAFKIVGHAAVGCASASAGGGDCGQGALSAGFGAAATAATNGNFLATVIAGGIGAELGGGKFANSALTAAMGYLSNCVAHECWAQGVDAHQALKTELSSREEGFKSGKFYDSDNNAFLGFPDAYLERDKMVWELKPDTPYGRLTGPEQIARYTAISGYSPGTAGPIFGLSDTLVLSGRLGSYTYTYGGNGIIFYNPNFRSPIENAFRNNANQILAPLPGRRRNSGLD